MQRARQGRCIKLTFSCMAVAATNPCACPLTSGANGLRCAGCRPKPVNPTKEGTWEPSWTYAPRALSRAECPGVGVAAGSRWWWQGRLSCPWPPSPRPGRCSSHPTRPPGYACRPRRVTRPSPCPLACGRWGKGPSPAIECGRSCCACPLLTTRSAVQAPSRVRSTSEPRGACSAWRRHANRRRRLQAQER